MAQNINPAYRIHKLLSNLSFRDNKLVIDAWSEIFQITHESQSLRAAIVSERLLDVHLESILVINQMKDKFSESLYAAQISRIQEALNPMLLPSTWNNVKQYLTQENLLAIAFCSEILPNEETLINESDLEEILKNVDELEALLNSDTLPLSLQTLIRRHIKKIRDALAIYPITGVKELKSVTHEAIGDLIEVAEELKKEAAGNNSEVIEKLKSTWQKINSVVETVENTDKLIEYGEKTWQIVKGFLT